MIHSTKKKKKIVNEICIGNYIFETLFLIFQWILTYFNKHFTKFDNHLTVLKNTIPNTYEMFAKISQNSKKLDKSKKTYQSIGFELLFLTLKFLTVGSCFNVLSGFIMWHEILFLFIFYKNECRHSCQRIHCIHFT